MSGTALENKYLALLQKGFSQAELEVVATAGGDVLFKLLYKDGFCRVNARAVEIHARALVPGEMWSPVGVWVIDPSNLHAGRHGELHVERPEQQARSESLGAR